MWDYFYDFITHTSKEIDLNFTPKTLFHTFSESME